jgi:hypothetical protein
VSTNGDYAAFLERKIRLSKPSGFEPKNLLASLFDWQGDVTTWACRGGRVLGALDTGLGKTVIQLAIAEQIVKQFGNVLILAPLAVAQQTAREAEKFGVSVDVTVCREPNDVRPGICITNYDRLHKFDVSPFKCVTGDEIGILKSYTSKTRNAMINTFRDFRFKYGFSATPAPNDHMELGNHAEFLDVMTRLEMLSNFFIHDSGETQKWRLKGHAVNEFWRWVSSWACCVTHPRDLGYEDDRFDLPPLQQNVHVVSCDECPPPDGHLFHTGSQSATGIHGVKRATAGARADKIAELISADDPDEPWIVWCDTNYEADELTKRIPDAVEIRGSDHIDKKEERLLAFSDGSIKRLVTKSEIAGHGLNWQHCNRMAMGATFSFERTYQSIRRCLRFGQERPVRVEMVVSDAEGSVLKTLQSKEGAFLEMQAALRDAIREHQLQSIYGTHEMKRRFGTQPMRLPEWL